MLTKLDLYSVIPDINDDNCFRVILEGNEDVDFSRYRPEALLLNAWMLAYEKGESVNFHQLTLLLGFAKVGSVEFYRQGLRPHNTHVKLAIKWNNRQFKRLRRDQLSWYSNRLYM